MKRTTVVGVIVVFLWLATIVPHVSALSVECLPTANLSEMTCNVTGDPSERFEIYLSSVNGVNLRPDEVILWVNSSGDIQFAWEGERGLRWFRPPAEVWFRPKDALYRIVREFQGAFSSDITWMFLGRRTRFTFTVIYPDNRSENFTAEVYLVGKANWRKILGDYLSSVAFAFVVLSFIALLPMMAVSLIARSLPSRKDVYLSVVVALLFILVYSSDLLSAVLFYFTGTPEHVHSDMSIGWGLVFILAMILLYSLGVHSWIFETNWRKKTLKELKSLKLGFCSGVSWFPWVLIWMKPSGIKVDYWIWLMVGLIFLFGFLTDKILSLLTPASVLGVNFALSLVLYQLLRPDVGFLTPLWLGLAGIYLSQKRCIQKFNAEKEKWVGELEKRLKKLEGTSPSTTSPSIQL